MATLRTTRASRSRADANGAEAMPIIVKDVPPGYDWGWYSREDPRMHLQVVDRKHAGLGYKIWLESKGKRVFEPVGNIPAKILKLVRAEVDSTKATVEAEWVHLMIEQRWLTYALHGTALTLIAYRGTPNRFERTIDLAPHLGIRVDEFQPQDVGLNSEYAVIELWPQKPISRRPFIPIAPILWPD